MLNAIVAMSVSVFAIIIGLFVYFKNRASLLNRYFCVAQILAGLFNLTEIVIFFEGNEFLISFVFRLAYVFGCFFVPAFSGAIFSLMGIIKEKFYRKILFYEVILAAVFSILFLFTKLIIVKIILVPLHEIPGSLYGLFGIAFLTGLGFCLYKLISTAARETSVKKRNQYLFTFVSFSIAGLAFIFFIFSLSFPHLRPLTFLIEGIYVFLFAYTIVKHNLMDIRIAVTRGAIFSLVYIPVLSLPIISAVIWEPQFEKLLGHNWWIAFFIVCASISYIDQIIYNYMRTKAEQRILKKQKEYQHALVKTSKQLLEIRNKKELLNKIINTLSTYIGISNIRIFVFNERNRTYTPDAVYGINLKIKTKKPLKKSHVLIHFINNECKTGKKTNHDIYIKEAKALFCDDISTLFIGKEKATKELINETRLLNISLIIPNFMHNKLISFIALGNKTDKSIYSEDDLKILTSLGNQLALALENAQFYIKLKEEQTKELHKMKLMSLGELAAGFAHQINNPLNVIMLGRDIGKMNIDSYGKKIEENGFSHELFTEMKHKIYNDFERIGVCSERMSQIVKNIMGFSKPSTFESSDIRTIIQGGINLISKNVFERQKIKLDIKIPDNMPIVYVKKIDLQQVIMNLCTNAVDAIEMDGTITIEAEINAKKPKFVNINITDTGKGIPKKDFYKIFETFYTTKGSKGTGLGLSLVQRVIHENRGHISINSIEDKGTTFLIQIPIYNKNNV
ncbi:ATP-binding protein [bacterium]